MQLRDSIPSGDRMVLAAESSRVRATASLGGALAVLGLTGALGAQGETAPDAVPAVPPAPRYARVEVDQQPVRCFAHENSPLYVDRLAQGDVVQIGEESHGFVQVALPLGVTGYVHKKFATEPDDAGFVRTSGKRVSFRYRPRSTEAPADALDDGVALHYMGDENDWYIVRNPRTLGYVPASALATLEAPAAAAGWTKFETARREEWTSRNAERVQARQHAARVAEKRGELDTLIAQFASEAGKPWEQQQRGTYETLEAAVGKMKSAFDAGSSENLKVATLSQEIRKQILVLDAQAVAKEKLPPPRIDNPVVKPPVEDPLAAFDLVGWIRVVRSALPNRNVRLVRGGRVLGYLTCSNDRYDLAMFEGVEVGVVGPKEAAADGTWILDVQRLDVLGIVDRQ
ncbi:MAG: hypothetical protein R3F56_19370 [Planctomycetota bacterium]